MIEKDKLFKALRNVLDMGYCFSGISVSDEAIKKAVNGNEKMQDVLFAIIRERIEWWYKCDYNKWRYAKDVYDLFLDFTKK